MSSSTAYLGYPAAKYHTLTLAADRVLLLSFNRPPVNSWIDAKWQELAQILRTVRDDPNVAAIVVAGEGRCFTAGLDINEPSLPEAYIEAPDAARKALAMRAHVYSTHDARFSIKEIDVGLAADIGTLQRFPKIVGNDSLARELCYTARDFGATEARQIGFLSKIVQGGRDQVVAAAVETASIIASKAPVAVRGTKIYLLHSRDHSVEEGLKYTQALNSALLQSEDMPVAMLATMQKQVPKFAKL